MRFFILTLFFTIFSFSSTLACEGFNNAMGALEHAVKETAPETTSTKTPPIAAINRAIDELEAAIEKDRVAKDTQKTTQQRL